KVRALTRVATPDTEERLLRVGQTGTAAHVEQIVRGWRRGDRQGGGQEGRGGDPGGGGPRCPGGGGSGGGWGGRGARGGGGRRGGLEAGGKELQGRGRARGVGGPALDPPTPAQRQADALALVAETALAKGLDPGPGSERYQVVVHVDAAALADPGQPGQ